MEAYDIAVETIIGNVFFRLDIIESFGTGIKRIKNSYRKSKKKPIFKIYENSVEITLPVISGLEELSDDQNLAYSISVVPYHLTKKSCLKPKIITMKSKRMVS